MRELWALYAPDNPNKIIGLYTSVQYILNIITIRDLYLDMYDGHLPAIVHRGYSHKKDASTHSEFSYDCITTTGSKSEAVEQTPKDVFYVLEIVDNFTKDVTETLRVYENFSQAVDRVEEIIQNHHDPNKGTFDHYVKCTAMKLNVPPFDIVGHNYDLFR